MAADLAELAAEIEEAGVFDGARLKRVRAALAEARPGLEVSEATLTSTEALLHLTDQIVPGWSIHLRGKALEPDGHWRCFLRRSSGSDSDEFIGRGQGPVPSAAILAATLRALHHRSRREAIAG